MEEFLKSNKNLDLSKEDISRCVDPTVCFECNADNGDVEWETIGNLPACRECTHFFRHRPFPQWLKIASVIFLFVTAAAFTYNWRFFMAYVDALRGHRAVAEGRFDEGVTLLVSAGERVPEIPEMGYWGKFFRSQQLSNENPKRALELLDEIKHLTPADMQDSYDLIRRRAEISLAFDRKDYDDFLAKVRLQEELQPDDPLVVASVASALACKYATTLDTDFRTQAIDKLAEAKKLVVKSVENEFEEYENRILHRLDSGEIISFEEFKRRFPNGWNQESTQ